MKIYNFIPATAAGTLVLDWTYTFVIAQIYTLNFNEIKFMLENWKRKGGIYNCSRIKKFRINSFFYSWQSSELLRWNCWNGAVLSCSFCSVQVVMNNRFSSRDVAIQIGFFFVSLWKKKRFIDWNFKIVFIVVIVIFCLFLMNKK